MASWWVGRAGRRSDGANTHRALSQCLAECQCIGGWILALKRLTVKGRETEKAGVTMSTPGRAGTRESGLGVFSLAELGLASGACWDCLGKEQQQVTGINRTDPNATWVAGPAH